MTSSGTPAAQAAARGTSRIAGVVGTVFVALYPFAVFFGARRWGGRVAGLMVAALGAGALLARGRAFAQWRAAVLPVLGGLALALGAAALDDHRLMLLQPVMVNALLLMVFAGSLRTATPICERFARLQSPELSTGEVAYCRALTVVWCVFFVANGAIAGLLAAAAPLAWWGLYTGLLSYVAIGALFTVEYLIRRRRFPQPAGGLPERIIARLRGHGGTT